MNFVSNLLTDPRRDRGHITLGRCIGTSIITTTTTLSFQIRINSLFSMDSINWISRDEFIIKKKKKIFPQIERATKELMFFKLKGLKVLQ